MVLPAPSLDDRRFQDLVDDAKRYVMRRCPEWTDHNVSDPGVTLIEAFAFMTEQLCYRLDRVPDRLYVKFLELLGLRMLPPTPAEVPVTFWLSTPARSPLVIRAGTAVSTTRTESEESVVFSTIADLPVLPTSIAAVRRVSGSGVASENQTTAHEIGQEFAAFGEPPQLDDALLIGLRDPAPACAMRLDFRGETTGVGVNPLHPPLVWEAWTGTGWTGCDVTTDETGGLNRSGRIVVHLPRGHEASVIEDQRAGWLRVRVVEPLPGQPSYSSSPVVRSLAAGTVGATAAAVHGRIVEFEELGESEGVPGQRFRLNHAPVLAGAHAAVIEVAGETGWQEWTQVDGFATSGPHDRHFVLDGVAGEVEFGPAVRLPDRGLHQYGAVPPPGARVRARRYYSGGGLRGNVARHAVDTLKGSIPFVAGVTNLHPASGGVDGETLEEAKTRGPIMLRTRSRAVTAEDYEAISREAAPEVARIHCLTAGEDDVAHGAVKVLVVPAAAHRDGQLLFADLVPAADTLERIARRLDDVRLVGTRVLVEPPRYRGVTVVARLVARTRLDPDEVRTRALTALYSFINPLTGGEDGTGWAFGRRVSHGEVFALLQSVRGVDVVEDVRLYGANPVTGERGAEVTRLPVGAGGLAFSYDHQVRVERS
ncbi:putative baseplate assembly protein [Actinokineospora spheciospongiae]|uniref:putative baseplate assembly protein n=1 Tax=Actinokineospora spheciospongiae TaxID=909613 RepID=UPI000D714F17|nr:putative baseplate assembly protein [Actinokineospora spheciospongiae]PWW66548.1 putative phage baseplate assembly protein [Actinokineospora spheciospongiae]